MEAATTTVQVRRETAQRLHALKVPGLTYDDVINFALDRLPPDEIEALFRQWQAEALAKLVSRRAVTSGKKRSRRA